MANADKFSDLDSFDRELIKVLRADARATAAELGEKVGLSPSAAHRRVKILEQRGIITGYRAVIAENIQGKQGTVFVHVTLQDQRRETFEKFEKVALTCAPIEECHLMSGEADYLLKIVLRDSLSYEDVHRDVLSTMPGVSKLVSQFSIRTVKML
ncbi:Lrp/AsnC family transcriptional regulator [Asticcacaulis endophyticus]|uniref:AsnC family transcriptional regulator n=1 Tax=Asticcacaulis endophyticus TaxID=1395890 RepID=A0A918Q2D8_9CAUL|nr:Lrp/AsnC family transcriptional regulator [Asticcacaulis endophyticus]GGZ30025.1 AsnC family transcriptional regulator [Asticcacaulis endophyticus]